MSEYPNRWCEACLAGEHENCDGRGPEGPFCACDCPWLQRPAPDQRRSGD